LIGGIERPILKDAASRLDQYKAGELDLVQLERTDIGALADDAKYKAELHLYPRPDTFYVAFNPKVYPPFASRDVRRAFAMAVDTRELASKTLQGLNQPADGILPPGVLGRRTKTETIGFDTAHCKRLLVQAGFHDPSAMPPLDLYIRGDNRDARIVGEAVQSYFGKNLGVSVTLKPLDWTTFLEKRNRHELPLFILDWTADYLDPENFISLLFSTAGKGNRTGYGNSQVDALCATADAMGEKDPERLKLYANAEDLILQDAPWIPLYFGADRELISPRVRGIRDSAFGHLPHTTVSLQK
jgi:oligopeptide transport system substrate-binding protein